MPCWRSQPWYSILMNMIIDMPRALPKGKKNSDPTYEKGSASTSRFSQFNGMSHIREQLRNTGFSNKTTSIVLASWRISTQKQCVSHQNNQFIFGSRKLIDPYSPSTVDVLEFLIELFKKALGYSCINTARCALSALITKIHTWLASACN